MAHEGMYRGDLVQARSPSAIPVTLDETGAMAGLPIMPELAAYCGQRFKENRRGQSLRHRHVHRKPVHPGCCTARRCVLRRTGALVLALSSGTLIGTVFT